MLLILVQTIQTLNDSRSRLLKEPVLCDSLEQVASSNNDQLFNSNHCYSKVFFCVTTTSTKQWYCSMKSLPLSLP